MKYLKFTLIVFLIYISASLISLRYIVNNIDLYQVDVEQYISEKLGKKFKIKEIEGDWGGLYPTFRIVQKKTSNSSDEKIANINEALISVDIYKTIFLFRPIIKSIDVENISATFNLDKGYSGSIKNIPQAIRIRDSKISFIINKKKYFFENFNIDLEDDKLIINTSVLASSNDFKIFLNISNISWQENSITDAEIDMILSGNIDTKKISLLNNLDGFEFICNQCSIESSLLYEDQKFTEGYNTIEKLHKGNEIVYKSNKIKDIAGSIIWKNSEEGLYIEAFNAEGCIGSCFSINNIAFSFSGLNKKLYSYIENSELKNINIIKDYLEGKNHKNIYPNFDVVDGFINSMYLYLDLDNENDLFFKSDIKNGSFRNKDLYVKNFSGIIEYNSEKLFLDIDSKDFSISYLGTLRVKNNYEILTGKIYYDFIDSYLMLEDYSIINEEISLSGDTLLDLKANKIHSFLNIKYLALKSATKYIPKQVMTAKTSRWFKSSLLKGEIHDGLIYMNGSIDDFPFYDNSLGVSYAFGDMENVKLRYSKDWLSLNNFNIFAEFNNRECTLNSSTLKILDSKFPSIKGIINDIDNPKIKLVGNFSGPITDIFKYLKKPNLVNINNSTLNSLSGNSKTNFSLNLSFEDDIKYSAKVKISNVEYKVSDNFIFNKITGLINLDNGSIGTDQKNPITGLLNNNKITINLSTHDNGNIALNGKASLNNEGYRKINYLNKYVNGSSIWEYKVILPPFSSLSTKPIKVYTSSNLIGTKVILPSFLNKKLKNKRNIKLNLMINEGVIKGLSFNYSSILGELRFNKEISGYINLNGNKKKIPNKGIELTGNIKRLDINDWSQLFKEGGESELYDSLKSVSIGADKLIYNDYVFENFKINFDKPKKSIIFNNISSYSDFYNIKIVGSYEYENQTKITLKANGESLEKLLNLWHINHSLRDSKFESSADLKWKGSPIDFSKNNISGSMNLNLKDGRIKKVGSRVSRLLGLFNIDLLTKRLSLDFDDVTRNGFSFKSMVGDFRIDSGQLFTTNLLTKGPSAQVLAIGTTDIVNETYDMNVVATPQVGETLPAIALLGGPIAAAATFAAEKLAKAFGKDIDDLIKIKYRVTGTWDDPIIEVIDKPFDPLDEVEELFE